MRTYTEQEIKDWFKKMKKRYPNSNTYQHLTSVEFMMFEESFGESDCLKNIKSAAGQINLD